MAHSMNESAVGQSSKPPVKLSSAIPQGTKNPFHNTQAGTPNIYNLGSLEPHKTLFNIPRKPYRLAS